MQSSFPRKSKSNRMGMPIGGNIHIGNSLYENQFGTVLNHKQNMGQ